MIALTAASLAWTPAAIWLAYLDWTTLTFDFPATFAVLGHWPWARGGLCCTAIAFLYPFYAVWHSGGNKGAFSERLWLFCGFAAWVPPLQLYPGLRKLGLHSDPSGIGAVALIAIGQSVYAWTIGRYAWRDAPWSEGTP